MEIEVGDYVRDKDGEIHKIIEINNPNDELWTYYKFENNMGNYKETIIKHSKNIIDLIEVGDYVNGYKVIGVTLDPAPSGKCVDIDCDKPSYESYLFEEQIYSIVTKEQFASMEYKVE